MYRLAFHLRVAVLAISTMALPQSDGTPQPGGSFRASPQAEEPAEGESTPGRLDRLEKEIEAERRRNEALRRQIEVLERKQFEMEAAQVGVEDAGRGHQSLGDKASELDERYGPGKGGVYSKSFLQSVTRRAYLGGYMDLEFVDRQGQVGSFVQHRFIPLIYVDASERLKFAAEIEFEFGGSDASAGDGETKVEFATMDYVFDEALTFRAGAVLVPLGKFNLIHDSPINDLTDRPLVDRLIIPTTFTEAGLGFHGTLYPVDSFTLLGDFELDPQLTYEAYLVNGFRGLVEDSSSPTGFRSLFNDTKGLRDGRASLKVDSNDAIAGAGRVAISPFLGFEVGSSVHAGPYDDRGENMLVIYAFDFLLRSSRPVPLPAGLELQGEIARAEISRDSLARASGVPDDMWGYYVQANYHFMPEWLINSVGVVFTSESTFTAVARLGQVELDSNRMERVTVGLNFRPAEETVFKFDYQLNFEDWNRRAVDNDAFLFSVATYF